MQIPDKVSAFLGAPPNHWKKSEIQQIKQIHHCYRNAFNVRNLEDNRIGYVNVAEQPDFALQYNKSQAVHRIPGTKNLTKNDKSTSNGEAASNEVTPGEKARQEAEGDKRDEEWYLPKDSPLRSKDGDKKAPLNPTFKDFEAFEKSCEFDFWREHFEGQSQDRFLSEVAETIVANICNAQSRHELRVMNGTIPLRKRREHITPLALVLHEMKLWATNVLRGASVFEEDTYKELKYRVQYLEGLSHKEVWGDAAVALGAGMRSLAHEKLFRLLLTTKEALERAHEYAYRGYCRRSSREKLARLGNLLKNTVLREMRILSGIMTLDRKLSDPKTKRLQPTDLLNSIQNQSFVDYKNMVNVLMYRLCNIPLVKAALTSDYEGADVKKELAELEQWTERNLFCVPNTDDVVDEPFFLLDVQSKESKFLPKAYRETAIQLKKLIRAVDPRAPLPLPAKDHAKLLIAAFESEDAAKSVVKLMMKNAAAIQELIPMIYVIHQLWGIAGDGGDFTVYDTLREQVIVVMSSAVAKVKAVQETEKVLLKEIGDLSKVKEKNMELRQLKTGTPKYKPAWIMNFKFLHTDLLPASSKGHNELIKQLFEVAEDAWRYNLTSEELDDKIESCKKMVDAVSGEKFLAVKKGAEDAKAEKKGRRFEGEFNVAEVVKAGNKKDWLYSNERSGDDQFGKNDAFGAGNLSNSVAIATSPFPDNSFKSENDKVDFEKEDSEEEPDKFNPFAAANGNDSDED